MKNETLLKSASAATGLYAIVWLALEGSVARDLLLAIPLSALGMYSILARFLGGRTLSPSRLIALSSFAGLAYGIGLALMMLFLMALKTGLHAHGPEYMPAEVAWVWRQLPLWGSAGALAGLGLGFLSAAKK
ncbi:MAG TPA: hypothetical protein PKE20_02165 [Promineifilum sp.]|nr:hypothetical protein [Promineifilum sp.]